MHIQPEILCAAGVPGQLLHHVAVRLPGMKHPMKRIVDTDILSPGVACKNSGNWNGAVLVRSLILSAAYEYLPLKLEGIHSYPVSSYSAWAAGYDQTLSGIPDSC